MGTALLAQIFEPKEPSPLASFGDLYFCAMVL